MNGVTTRKTTVEFIAARTSAQTNCLWFYLTAMNQLHTVKHYKLITLLGYLTMLVQLRSLYRSKEKKIIMNFTLEVKFLFPRHSPQAADFCFIGTLWPVHGSGIRKDHKQLTTSHCTRRSLQGTHVLHCEQHFGC
jgi:hypothetical protein